MQRADLLTLLAIIIALSAYLATVRLFMIDRLTKLKEKTTQLDENLKKAKRIRKGLLVLLLADVPMTLSAVLLGIYILYSNAPSSFLRKSICLFTFAGL